MGSVKRRDLLTGAILFVFLALCFHLHQKGKEGPWHSTAMLLWQKEDWGKIQALGDNLFRVKKEDPESFYLAMMAAQQNQNPAKVRIFAERLSATHVLNWKMESALASVYQPDSLLRRIALFRTRMIYALLLLLIILSAGSFLRQEPYHAAPIALAALGIVVLLL
jgi:hypothetical protein